MTYQEETQTLTEQASAQVLAALSAYAAGTLTYEAVAAVVAAYVAAGNSAGAALGDVALAAAVTLQTGQPAAPLGITRPADEDQRLTKAAKTILDDLDAKRDEDAEAALSEAQKRFQRLVEAEIRKAVADAYSEAIKESESVTGWIRALEPDACELCTWWWRNGRVWPADHDMPRHTGCDCGQLVVTTTEPIKPVRVH
ncbi:MAG TPA: hypothetical protein VGE38_03570 [Nocardioides sp.]|uniref:hypothetical protein n=1 Tax=Nocardioides sp. TaxID=35761 RepID=UPI002EDA5659